MLNAEMPTVETEWRTGVSEVDEFTGVYRVMAAATKTRRGFAPHEVDLMDIATVAVLMGVGSDPGAEDRAALEQIARRRTAGEDAVWDDMPEELRGKTRDV